MIRLTRSIDVFVFESEATVAIGRDRPEFLAVARLAADLGRPIGARDVLRELLGSRPEVVGWKVIDRCVALGLLERKTGGPAALSDGGRAALEHGSVLVPEEGLWRFYYVDDPLLPDVLLHVERLHGQSAKDERQALTQARKRGDGRPARPDPAPQLLQSCEGAAPYMSVARECLFQLVKLGEGGQHTEDTTFRLTLEWDSAPKLALRGNLPLEGADPLRVDAQGGAPEAVSRIGFDPLWMSLVSHATGVSVPELQRWRQVARKLILPVRFDANAEAAMRGFVGDLPVPAMRFDELGTFDATTLQAVPLTPATDDDAQRWFEWLQWNSVTGYATPAQLEEQARSLASRFPYHRPRPRTALELLSRARTERGDRAWNLLAPSDLGLWS
jgi:hypothetical protein